MENADSSSRRHRRVAVSDGKEERDSLSYYGGPFIAHQKSPFAPGEGLTIIGHELHAPITPLKLRLQQTQRRLQRESGRERDIEDVAKALYQVDRIQHQISVFIEAGALLTGAFILIPRWCDLSEIARRLRDTYSSAYTDRTLFLKNPARPLDGYWDAPRLETVLRELVGNALKYTNGDVALSLKRRGPNLRIDVQDSGPGIPFSIRERIFEPYGVGYQSSHGLGLGLYVARGIAQAHGGQLTLRGTADGGTLFTLTLPIVEW
ncbi:MAG TPA: HAMP domain-containing sensor histidine kinase [Ktedonobacterales bacterium]